MKKIKNYKLQNTNYKQITNYKLQTWGNKILLQRSLLMKGFCGGGQGGQFFQKAPPLAGGK